MARISKLTLKDMTVLREQDSPREQHKQTRGAVRDLSGKHQVTIFWDLSEECKKDMIFKMAIDDYEVLLDAEQVKRYLRWV
jgi:hypothetical protein